MCRKHEQLLLSFVKPHGPISRDTLSRWTLLVLSNAGVDVSLYRGHSTRGAAASAACRLGVPLNLILKQVSVHGSRQLRLPDSTTRNWILMKRTWDRPC